MVLRFTVQLRDFIEAFLHYVTIVIAFRFYLGLLLYLL